MSSILLWGPPGTGKSTLAASMTGLGYHVHFIDLDKKVRTMKNLEPLLKSKKISIHELQSPLLETTLSQRLKLGPKQPPLKSPKGYLEMADYIDKLQQQDYSSLPEGVTPANTVLVLDSLTRATQHMKRYLYFLQKKTYLEFGEWSFVLMNYEELFDSFFGLQPDSFAHCIITAHAMTEKDEQIQTIEAKPMVDGQMRDKISGYVDECYYTMVEAKGQAKAMFKVQTKPSGRVTQARSSRDVATFVDADFSKIFAGEHAPGGKP